MLATGQQLQSNTPSDAGALLALSLLGNSIQKKKTTLKITPSTFPFLLPLGFYVPWSERLFLFFLSSEQPPLPPALLLPILETEHKPRTVNREVRGEMGFLAAASGLTDPSSWGHLWGHRDGRTEPPQGLAARGAPAWGGFSCLGSPRAAGAGKQGLIPARLLCASERDQKKL